MRFTIGSDVEVFGKQGEKHISLCGRIGGTKEEPLQVPNFPTGFMVQEDNVSLEFNIPPTSTSQGFITNITEMLKQVVFTLHGLGCDVSHEASVSFDTDQLQHPNALVFGCEPDYNAWTKRENAKPQAEDNNLRTAGGHIHVGISTVDMLLGIKAMDLFLGVPSILLDNSPSSMKRRELYGKAGAMRPKPYGFEYRTLSNFWIFEKHLIRWVYYNTELAMEFAYKMKRSPDMLSNAMMEKIQHCINTGNSQEAEEIIKIFDIPMPINRDIAEEIDMSFAPINTGVVSFAPINIGVVSFAPINTGVA